MCKKAAHAPGCQRLDCWAYGVDFGMCPKGCKRIQQDGSYAYPTTDCSMGPGVCCSICGTYWIPDAIPEETLAEMRADYVANMLPSAAAGADKVFNPKHRQLATVSA
jgi:hypothetical protein